MDKNPRPITQLLLFQIMEAKNQIKEIRQKLANPNLFNELEVEKKEKKTP